MGEHTVSLARGLLNAPLPWEDEVAGGLAYARGFTYRPGSRVLRRAEGRARYQTDGAFPGPIRGLGWLHTRTVNKILIASGGNLYSLDVAEAGSAKTLVASGYDPTAEWWLQKFGEELFGVDGVDQPIAWDGTNLYRWGNDAPNLGPSATPTGAGAFGPATWFRYTYTWARIVNGVRVRESDPPIADGEILYAEVTGPDVDNASIVLGNLQTRPAWATHWIIYRTTDGGSSFLEEGETTVNSFTDTTITGAESPGSALNTDHQPPPNDAIGIFSFENKLGFWRKDEMGVFYSLAGEPHHFPYDELKVPSGNTHAIGLEETGSSKVYGAARVNQLVSIGLDDGLSFAERLPDSSDPQFVEAYSVRQGEVVGIAHSEDAFVGHFAWDTLRLSDDEDALVFASRLGRGICMTNGHSTVQVARGFDWSKRTVNPAAVHKTVLINNTALYRIEIYCPSPGSTVNDQVFYAHYHPSLTGGGGFPRLVITGPRPVKIAHGLGVIIAGRKRMLLGDAVAGELYIDSDGFDVLGVADEARGVTGWVTMPGKAREAQLYTVRPLFEGKGNFDIALVVRARTFHGRTHSVSRTFKGSVTQALGSDSYGDSSVARPAPEIRPKLVNLVGRMFQFEFSVNQLGADVALEGFHLEYEPVADYAKATG